MSALHPRSFRGLTFLVASPCDFTRELLLFALSAYGAEEIHESADGAEAVRQLRRRSVDVVLADLRMAPFDGLTLTRLIRREDTGRPRPTVVVLLADGPTTEDVLAARSAGIDDLIRFPFSAETLHRRLQRPLLRWRQPSSRASMPRPRGPKAPVWARPASPAERHRRGSFLAGEFSAAEIRALFLGEHDTSLGI